MSTDAVSDEPLETRVYTDPLQDFEVPDEYTAPDVTPLHTSHVLSARIELLSGDPQGAINRISAHSELDANTQDELFLSLRAMHLVAEANLEIGTPEALDSAIAVAQDAVELSLDRPFEGVARLYPLALDCVLAEAHRRAGSPDSRIVERLEGVLAEAADQSDPRFVAVEYVANRTLALILEDSGQKAKANGHFTSAHAARRKYMSLVSETPRTAVGAEALDTDKMRLSAQRHSSALLSALINFPYPSEDEASQTKRRFVTRRPVL